jgi:hypothetical protein
LNKKGINLIALSSTPSKENTVKHLINQPDNTMSNM